MRTERRLVCGAGHSFDVARTGYTNLLQPQDRKSKTPGDSAAAVAARRRLHDLGVSAPLLAGIGEMAGLGAGDVVLDAGCGDGFYLGSLQAATGCAGHGVDISVAAVEAAARRYPGCEWIVANADRQIPYGDGTFSRILSITGRRNGPEFRRVLGEGGRLVVAIPGPEDLREIRGEGRDRVGATVAELAAWFRMVRQERVSTRAWLNAGSVEDVRLAIYRPMQAVAAEAGEITFSLDLLEFVGI